MERHLTYSIQPAPLSSSSHIPGTYSYKLSVRAGGGGYTYKAGIKGIPALLIKTDVANYRTYSKYMYCLLIQGLLISQLFLTFS